jgi:hypothetical protein
MGPWNPSFQWFILEFRSAMATFVPIRERGDTAILRAFVEISAPGCRLTAGWASYAERLTASYQCYAF